MEGPTYICDHCCENGSQTILHWPHCWRVLFPLVKMLLRGMASYATRALFMDDAKLIRFHAYGKLPQHPLCSHGRPLLRAAALD